MQFHFIVNSREKNNNIIPVGRREESRKMDFTKLPSSINKFCWQSFKKEAAAALYGVKLVMYVCDE